MLNFSLRNTGNVISKRNFSGMIIYAQHSDLNFSKGDYGKPGTKGEGGDKGKPVFSIILTCSQIKAFSIVFILWLFNCFSSI